MERKSWKLWVLMVLAIVMVLVCGSALAGEGEGPVNPREPLIRQLEQQESRLQRLRGYQLTGISFTELRAPSLSQTGQWRINMDSNILGNETIDGRIVYIQSPDPNGGYSIEYYYDNPGDVIESCPFVAPGTYVLSVFYDLSDGRQYSGRLEIHIAEDGVHPTVQQKVAQILQECRVAGDDWQTALNLHDWLTHHAYYDMTFSFYGAEDVLLRGYGVCDSYTKAYQYLLNAAGITNRRVESDGHAWNMIQLDGEWYHVDVTWDDPQGDTIDTIINEPVSGKEQYDYFCINDDLIYGFLDDEDETHKTNATITRQCTSLAESYPVHTQEWQNYGTYWIDRYNYGYYDELFVNQIEEGDDEFTIQTSNAIYAKTIGPNGYSGGYAANTRTAKLARYYYAYGLSMTGIENSDGEVIIVSVSYDLNDMFFTVSVLGVEPCAEIEWELVQQESRWNLLLSGEGNMPNYASAAEVPWSTDVAGKMIDRVVVSSGITRIGSNAFAGLNDDVRIDFLQNKMPAVSADAFGGITAVCRYYSTDSSWSTATNTDTVTWIRLPAIANSDAPLEVRFQENSSHETEWAVGPRTESYNNQTPISADQAKEITYRDRWIVFDAIPTAAEDKAVYEGLDAPTVLLFMDGVRGSYTLDFTGKPAQLRWVESRPMGAFNLTVTAPEGNLLEELVICDGSQITYNGNVEQVTLKTTQWTTPEITINGNVGELTYYDAASDSPFKGTLTVSGTITHGTVHSQSSLYVPGISATDEPVQFGDIAAYTFENIQQTTPVITLVDVTDEDEEAHQESRLSIGNETIQPTTLSLSQFTIDYSFYTDRISFNLDPKSETELGNYSAYISNILAAEYNPNFTTADIIQGPDTVVYVRDTGAGENDPLIEFGDENATVEQTGIDRMYLQNCKVKVNWPVSLIMVWQHSYKQGPVVLEINSRVNDMGMFLNQRGGRISIGTKGYLSGGYWNRGILGDRCFGPVSAGETVAEDGELCRMSWKRGEETRAMPANDAAVTAAAGNQVASGAIASMDVQDATLSAEEQEFINTYLTNHGQDENNIINVFDVSVGTYQRGTNDSLTPIATLTELDHPVSVSVVNNAGETAKIVRLHQGTDGIQVDELENETETEGIYEFQSKLFSKYVLVSDEIPLKEKQLETGYTELTWYTGITPGWPSEPGLYSADGVGEFIVPSDDRPAGCEPVWNLSCKEGTDCFELFGYAGEYAKWYRTLTPKDEGVTTGTSRYEISCQVGNVIYRAEASVTVKTATLPRGIQLQKTSYDPATGKIGSNWTNVGAETDLASGEAIAIGVQYIGSGQDIVEDGQLSCMYYGGENSIIEAPERWSENGPLFPYDVQPIVAKRTGMDTVEFGVTLPGSNVNYYAKTDLYVNRSQMKRFSELSITFEGGKTQYYEGEEFTVSCPRVEEADLQEILVFSEDFGVYICGSEWKKEDQAENCTFSINTISDGQDRRLGAGQYSARVTLRGDGYIPAVFSKNFEIISMPDFTTFELPAETTEIGTESFAGIAAENIRIPDKCTTIGANAFKESRVEKVWIPASVTSIGSEAFPEDTVIFTPKGSTTAGWAAGKYECIEIAVAQGE